MADFKLHYYLLANNSKVHWYATSHSSSNMVTLVAADIRTRTSQQVAVKLSLESLILGCSILIPISSAQICGSFFSTLCTHPRSYLKKQSKTGNISCQCLRNWERGTSHYGQSTASDMQDKSTSVRPRLRHVGIR
jgi:hypothetical protein